MCLCAHMLALEWNERAFIEKVNSRCFCRFPAAIVVDQNCPPIWRLHTKFYKGAWNVSANNSETVRHKVLVFYNISFFLFILGFLHWTVSDLFSCALFIAWQWKRRIEIGHFGYVGWKTPSLMRWLHTTLNRNFRSISNSSGNATVESEIYSG